MLLPRDYELVSIIIINENYDLIRTQTYLLHSDFLTTAQKAVSYNILVWPPRLVRKVCILDLN